MVQIAPQEWFSAAELAELALPGLPTTERGVQLRAKTEGWAERRDGDGQPMARRRKGRGGGMEYHRSLLPEQAQLSLAAREARSAKTERPDRESMWLRFDRAPEGVKAEATRRLGVIQDVEKLMRAGASKERSIEFVVGQARREARAAGQDAPFSVRTVHSWFSLIRGVESCDRAAYLLPAYTGRAESCEISPEALDLYIDDYFRQSKPTHEAVYRRVSEEAAKRGWALPSQKTIKRRLDAMIPHPVQVLWREGPKALAASYPHMDRDRRAYGALEVCNLDGHKFDNLVDWGDGGKPQRPQGVFVQCVGSSKLLAVRLGRELNATLVRLALADVFRDYGIPEILLMDNGRENLAAEISGTFERMRVKHQDSEAKGLLAMLNITPLYATPRHGQAKPIERAFRDVAGEFSKLPQLEGTYTGKDTVSKPENYGSRAMPIAEFEALLRRWMVAYNARPGRTADHLAGRSFDQAYAELAERRPPRRATPEQLRLALLASNAVTMHRQTGAITIMGHRYWSQELAAVKRQKVIARYDPDNLAAPVYVYSLDGRFLCEAPRTAAGAFIDQASAKEHARLKRQSLKKDKESGELLRRANKRLAAATYAGLPDELPAPAPVDPKVVRLAFGVARTAEQAAARAAADAHDEALIAGLKAASGGG
jgi:hypothetical protein